MGIARLLGGAAIGFALLLPVTGASCGGAAAGGELTVDGGHARDDAGKDAGTSTVAGPGLVIVAAGDIACHGCAQRDTANLILSLMQDGRVDAILPLGDEAYTHGSLSEFEANYAPTWGVPQLLAISHPVPGNHEYVQPNGSGYFDYFDGMNADAGLAGERAQGYYSFDLGSWHVVALNTSNGCRAVSCDAGSPQQAWLAADLQGHPNKCTLAFWHNPRFQGGTESGETEKVGPLWQTFVDGGGDVVLNGHEHNYQQLTPLDRDGTSDPVNGVRTFVVGTGGAGFHAAFGGPHAFAIEASVVDQHGVLELTLMDSGYAWRFVAVGGQVPDGASGSAACR